MVHPSGVWIIGSFTSPQWQDGRVQMFEHQEYPGIYTTTLLVDGPEDIQYKFSNGEPLFGTPFQDGESENLDSLGCGSANGIGGWNRNLFGLVKLNTQAFFVIIHVKIATIVP